jgi:hypothetical protein
MVRRSSVILRGFSLAGIQVVLAALLLVTFRDGFWAGSGDFGQAWHPGISGEGVADGGQGAHAVLGGGGGVAADGVAAAGDLFGAEAAGDLLLRLRGPQVAFSLVRCRGIRARVRPGANPDGVSSAKTTAAGDDQRPDQHLHAPDGICGAGDRGA